MTAASAIVRDLPSGEFRCDLVTWDVVTGRYRLATGSLPRLYSETLWRFYAMKFTPNLGKKMRVLNLVVGLALIVGFFVLGFEGWLRWSLLVLGLASGVTGVTGW